MKAYKVSFIFNFNYIEAENESQALEKAQDCLVNLNWSDWDEAEVEEIEE